jgi:hypothetical protein
MTLDELITQTREQASNPEPIEVLASAARREQELADLGEQLLDYFVQEARAAGCSWSQIGTTLGVTKQAAQQRHSALRSLIGKFKGGVESTLTRGMFTRFTPAARRVVVLAQEQARRLRHDYIGTEHLLLGLLAEGEGVGAQALQDAGITLDAARAGIEEIIGCGEQTPSGHVPFTPRSKKVLELALRESRHLSHHYIGTEHILLGLLREGQGVGAQVIAQTGAQPAQLRANVLTLLDK